MKTTSFTWFIAVWAGLNGCAGGQVFKDASSEKKPASTQILAGSENAVAQSGAPVPVTVSRYSVNVNTVKGMNLCQGSMTLTIWSDFQMSPEGSIQCVMIGEKDLKSMFPQSKGGVNDMAIMKTLPEYGKIMRKPNEAPGPDVGVFTPPRPFIIGPVIQRPADFANYSYQEDSKLDYTTDAGQPIEVTGKFWVHVLEAGINFQPANFPQNFTSVVHFSVDTAGFDSDPNIPIAPLMLHKSVEYWFNTRPLAIPQILVHTTLSAVNPGALGNIANTFLGPIDITLSMIDFQQL